MDAAKTASERVVQETAEVTGDLSVNKIAVKIILVGRPKMKQKKKIIKQFSCKKYTYHQKSVNKLLMI